MKYSLLFVALASILIMVMIGVFTFREALPAFREIGPEKLLTESVWRPGQDQVSCSNGRYRGSCLERGSWNLLQKHHPPDKLPFTR